MQKKIIEGFFLFFPAFLAIVFFIAVSFDLFLLQEMEDVAIQPSPFPAEKILPYPSLQQSLIPPISAQSAIIMDADSHVYIYQKNTNIRLSPASTTKMMMALVSLEHFHQNNILAVRKLIDTQGSGLGFTIGEQFTYEELLKAALIYSANDAASVIAQNYPGGVTAFVAAMNQKAQELHLANTHFGDPDGLDDIQDYTTAKELVALASVAMEQPLFRAIVSTKFTTIVNKDGTHEYPINNRNILLGWNGINGIKTGYTGEAGEVLATSVINHGHTFYIIVMKSDNRFLDTEKLVNVLPKVIYTSPTSLSKDQ